jgi:hypothetical protein
MHEAQVRAVMFTLPERKRQGSRTSAIINRRVSGLSPHEAAQRFISALPLIKPPPVGTKEAAIGCLFWRLSLQTRQDAPPVVGWVQERLRFGCGLIPRRARGLLGLTAQPAHPSRPRRDTLLHAMPVVELFRSLVQVRFFLPVEEEQRP